MQQRADSSFLCIFQGVPDMPVATSSMWVAPTPAFEDLGWLPGGDMRALDDRFV